MKAFLKMLLLLKTEGVGRSITENTPGDPTHSPAAAPRAPTAGCGRTCSAAGAGGASPGRAGGQAGGQPEAAGLLSGRGAPASWDQAGRPEASGVQEEAVNLESHVLG